LRVQGDRLSAQPLVPARVEVLSITTLSDAETPHELEPMTLLVTLRNTGNERAPNAPLRIRAARATENSVADARLHSPLTVADVAADVPASDTVQLRILWSPPAPGTWLIQTNVGNEAGHPIVVHAAVAPAGSPDALFHAQALSPAAAGAAGAVLAAATALSTYVAVQIWRMRRAVQLRRPR
jgi:hypothetical protein